MLFVGHTRFSLFEPRARSWRLTRATGEKALADYKQHLFSESRLNTRAQLFLNHSLPMLEKARQRSNHKLLHIISYSEELPDKYQIMLQESATRYSWVVLDKRTPDNREGLTITDLVRHNSSPGLIYGLYRLDDDDLLSIDYFEQASAYLKPHFVRMVVSLGQGIQAIYSDEKFINPRIEHRPKIAIGLMQVCEFNKQGEFITPIDTSHTKTDLQNPVILDSRHISFVHSMHLTQDTDIDMSDQFVARRRRTHLRSPEVPPTVDLNAIFPSISFMENLEFGLETQ